jgi:hypothetical protein
MYCNNVNIILQQQYFGCSYANASWAQQWIYIHMIKTCSSLLKIIIWWQYTAVYFMVTPMHYIRGLIIFGAWISEKHETRPRCVAGSHASCVALSCCVHDTSARNYFFRPPSGPSVQRLQLFPLCSPPPPCSPIRITDCSVGSPWCPSVKSRQGGRELQQWPSWIDRWTIGKQWENQCGNGTWFATFRPSFCRGLNLDMELIEPWIGLIRPVHQNPRQLLLIHFHDPVDVLCPSVSTY